MIITATPGPTSPPATPTSTPAPTPLPTEVSREFRTYRHVSGVFEVTIPQEWEVLDSSTDQRLLVRCVPPIGYASRVTVDITNEGPLTPEQVSNLAESYIRLNYTNQGNYTEINRTELPDGRLQFVFLFDDRRGAQGRETLYIRQVGPYFSALRVFLSDKDTFQLSQAIDTIAASLAIDALAVWGTSVAAINPAELLIVNTTLWRDAEDVTHYMGEVYNASPSDITDVQVRLVLCNDSGIVSAEITQPAALEVVPVGGSSPFAILVADLPAPVTVCAEQATANPAHPDPSYTTALSLDLTAGFDRQKHLIVQGRLTNPGLSPVTDVDVVLAIYDASNRIVGYHLLAYGPQLELAPGQSVGLEVVFPELAGEAHRYLALAQGHVVMAYNRSLAPGG